MEEEEEAISSSSLSFQDGEYLRERRERTGLAF